MKSYHQRVKIFVTLFLLCAPLFGHELNLKRQLKAAQQGNYIVTEQGKTYAFLYIREISGDHLSLEEVAIPVANFQRLKTSWRAWFESGAPGHSLWTLSKINIASGAFEEIYSYSRQSHCATSESNSFLTTLLNLPFLEVPEAERRRVGFAPGYGKPDNRPLWSPRVVVEGLSLGRVPFTVYRARWPYDRSELSGKTIEIYFPQKIERESFPAFFPYVIEVEGKIGSAKLRVVDSGMCAHSPMKPRAPLSTIPPTFYSE